MQKNEKRLLKFAIQYPGWHSCHADSRATMRNLARNGLVQIRTYEGNNKLAQPQFRLALPLSVYNDIENARTGAK